MKSPLYRSPILYELAMNIFHGSSLPARYKTIAGMVAGNDRVLDVGCGTGSLADFLNSNNYVGIDLNESFVAYGQRKGRDLRLASIEEFRANDFDVIVLTDVLHHVAPRHERLLHRLRGKAKRCVILCEPYEDANRNWLTSWLIKAIDNDGVNMPSRWLVRNDLIEFYRAHGATIIREVGRDIIAELPAASNSSQSH